MTESLQHLLAIALALGLGSAFVVRRVRSLRRGDVCDGCARECSSRGTASPSCEQTIPASSLLRGQRGRNSTPS